MAEIEKPNQTGLPPKNDTPDSEFELALKICRSLSSYQLTRLSYKIDNMADDPDRISAVKSLFAPGDLIQYFSPEENRDVDAVLLKHNRTRASVQRNDNGERWKISYSFIRTDDAEYRPLRADNKLNRDDISVDDFVGFKDRQNQERFGKVVRINQKTVTIECEDGSEWRVAFSILTPIIDANSRHSSNGSGDQPKQQLLIE